MSTSVGKNNVFRVARITIETTTPLSIATGKASGVFDSSLVTDANGLPAIPGTAFAGVLRHLYQTVYGESAMEAVFGYQDRDVAGKSLPSRLHVSWGCVQNSQGQAVQGLQLGQQRVALEEDPVLKLALALAEIPETRDRVRIGHKGAAAGTAKFERAVLPAGYRFTLELSMWGGAAHEQDWHQVLGLLHHPLLRLGGATRAGLGRLRPVVVLTQTMVLSGANGVAGRQQIQRLSRDMNDYTGFDERYHMAKQATHSAVVDKVGLDEAGDKAKELTFPDVLTALIRLQPNAYWRIGQGDQPQLEDTQGKSADLLPKLEQSLEWAEHKNDNGEIVYQATPAAEKLLIPGASVKGALAHRVAFHANRFSAKPRWADDVLADETADAIDDHDGYEKSEHCPEVRELFGYANDTRDTKGSFGKQDSKNKPPQGLAGKVMIDDAYRAFSAKDLQLLVHNSIDRFSGSVRDHMLFTEEMVWGKGIEIQLTLRIDQTISQTAKQALKTALDDLQEGRLALGGGAAKGHGFFSGTVEWSDNGQWLKEVAA